MLCGRSLLSHCCKQASVQSRPMALRISSRRPCIFRGLAASLTESTPCCNCCQKKKKNQCCNQMCGSFVCAFRSVRATNVNRSTGRSRAGARHTYRYSVVLDSPAAVFSSGEIDASRTCRPYSAPAAELEVIGQPVTSASARGHITCMFPVRARAAWTWRPPAIRVSPDGHGPGRPRPGVQ